MPTLNQAVVNDILFCAKPMIALSSLWMYKFTPLSSIPFQIFSWDFISENLYEEKYQELTVMIESAGTLHGIIMWIDYHLYEATISSSPFQKPKEANANRHVIFLFDNFSEVNSGSEITCKATFDAYDKIITLNYESEK